jgi:hypothetical protein
MQQARRAGGDIECAEDRHGTVQRLRIRQVVILAGRGLQAGEAAVMLRLLERHLKRGGLAVLTSHQSVELKHGLRTLLLS